MFQMFLKIHWNRLIPKIRWFLKIHQILMFH
jgi:hypothetical protein